MSFHSTPSTCRGKQSLTASFVFLIFAIVAFSLNSLSTHQRLLAQEDSQTIPVDPVDREGEDWTRFLGPRGTGVSGEKGLLDNWPVEGPPLVWSKEIGIGYSSPSILGNRMVVHHRPRDGRNPGPVEVVECLQATDGKSIWKYEYPSSFSDPYGYNEGPRCSPVLEENRCFTLGPEGMLLCLDLLSGQKVWEHQLKEKFEVPDGFFGVGCNPIIDGDKLIVLVGGQSDAGVVAFNKETGDIIWEAVGKKTWEGVSTGQRNQTYTWTGDEALVSYSSPIVATFHGKKHLICLMRQGLVSLDPETGEENFKYWFMSRTFESVNAATPVVIDDKIFISAAYRVGSALLEVGEDGNSYEVLWRDTRNMLTHWSTAIQVGDYLYGFSGRHENEGHFTCISVESGKVEWQTRGFEGDPLVRLEQNPETRSLTDKKTGVQAPWPYYGRGSMILADGKFIVLGERGTLALVEVSSEEFKEISRTFVEGLTYPTWAAPILSRKRLYLRAESKIFCFDLAGE
ncbi:outer membrane biogenesis protein BamB [Polystyrenella longa]|uniref:Outer membrane biogenesis protein BamB n=1 Tax=Polystyrenella longa TaxID=2528007 RepID=A0A518CSD6_9PLAN|nr:PQQ-binding-like beta-propeller repeat protein [Polystyrenella longa]QDU82125.1 outer membrane biogenesis protein BamB [Polystyrenella longa]